MRKICLIGGLGLVLSLLAACGGGSGGSTGGSSDSGGNGGTGSNPPPPSATITGMASKGPLLDAIVTFYPVTNGKVGTTVLATTRTDASTGAFSSPVSSSGAVVATLTVDSSTQMLDELAGKPIPAPSGLVLHAAFDGVTNLAPLAITPLTEMAYDIATNASGGLTTANIDAANNAVGQAFLNGASILSTQPIALANYPSATPAEQEQAKLLTALAVAATEGTATDASGTPCNTGSYGGNLVCLIGGLGNLLTVDATGSGTLTSAANYVAAAYTSIDQGVVTVNGGQTPASLGLNTTTAAETSFASAIATQAPLPGFDAGADPLANTKALMANIRTNILDQSTTQTFGVSPVLQALSSDFKTNVSPVLAGTRGVLSGAYQAVQLIQLGTTSAGLAPPSTLVSNPIAVATDSAGNVYAAMVDTNIIVKISGSNVSLYAGQPGVAGHADGAALQATFNHPAGLAVDAAGDVYVVDAGNSLIRKIAADGTVSTLAGQVGVPGHADGQGSAATFTFNSPDFTLGGSVLHIPTPLAIDAKGNLYVPNIGGTYGIDGIIRVITPAGSVSTLAISANTGDCAAYQSYYQTLNNIPAGVLTSCLPPFGTITGVAVDGSGNVFVTALFADTVVKISGGTLTTFAGQLGVSGSADGTGTGATLLGPYSLTSDASGNLYVWGTNVWGTNVATSPPTASFALRKITPGAVVSTLLQQSLAADSSDPTQLLAIGLAVDPSGNIWAVNLGANEIQEVTPTGTVSEVVRAASTYRGGCGYDPIGLATADNVALCRYSSGSDQILLTVTQGANGSYSLQTQPLAPSSSGSSSNPVLADYAPVASIPALSSTFTLSGSTGAQTATFSGPYYVTAAGGQVTGSFTATESNFDPTTYSGTVSLSGTLSGGSGGISLVQATLGSDSSITLQNGIGLANLIASVRGAGALTSSGASLTGLSGTLDLQNLETSAFSYALKASLSTPTTDKSGTLSVPASLAVSGSIAQLSSGSSVPLFSGSIGVNLVGIGSYDATQPYSATNSLTVQAQVSGLLSLPGGRVLNVSATANGSQLPADAPAAAPDSFTVSYSYSTPSGTATLNATGQYDGTNGLSGTITNNAGVTVQVTDPIGGPLAGTVTANGQNTATIKGSFIYYSDGTSESLY